MNSLTQQPCNVEGPTLVPHDGVAVECGTLAVFLEALRCCATVLLMPVERTVRFPESKSWVKQSAVHVTGRSFAQGRPVYFCTYLAAEASVTSPGDDAGRLLYPYEQEQEDPAIGTRTRLLAYELLQHLQATLQDDARVQAVRAPARFCLPQSWVWGGYGRLAGTGIAFENGHWRLFPQEAACR